MIPNIPIRNLVEIWGELVEALCNKNGYGGDTIELYTYRLRPYSHWHDHPRGGPLSDQYSREENLEAAQVLYDILRQFKEHYGCVIYIDQRHGERRLGKWVTKIANPHRWHIRIKPGRTSTRFSR